MKIQHFGQLGGAAAAATFSTPLQCPDLRNLHLPNSSIVAASYLPENFTIVLPNAHPTCPQNATTLVPVCRVEITTKTSTTSSVKTEAWLPADRASYPRRVASVGNGGISGCIDYFQLRYLSSLGFAAIGSDGGHAGFTGVEFLNNSEVVVDFAHRAIHVESGLIKKVAAAYYGISHKKSYYMACSNGGRQGFKAIEEYPEDFDGVLAGAPSLDFNHLIAASAILGNAQGYPGSPGNLPPPLLDLIYADIISQCDALDGVINGVIDDPNACDYRPSQSLLCSSNTTATPGHTCVTPAQLSTITKLFTPINHPLGGQLAPRFDPGAAFQWLSTRFELYYNDWYKYAVYNDASLDPTSPNFNTSDAIIAGDLVDSRNGEVSTWAPAKLSSFAKRGGKLLTYHGLSDGFVVSGVSLRHFDEVKKAMGQKRMSEFYQLFAVPGLGHCTHGPGAGGFGQVGYPGATALKNDEKHNAVFALVDWVEKGKVPEELVGWNERTGQTRRLCAWPKKSVLRDGGDRDRAEGWKCVD